jgi:predicted oxidoreductase (fatty acid repression mutant protein)
LDLDQALKGRRSIRSYAEKEVSISLVRQVIEAGTFAPSAKNGQQWRFMVLGGKAKTDLTTVFRAQLENVSQKIGRDNMGSSFSSCAIMEQAPIIIMVWNAGERMGNRKPERSRRHSKHAAQGAFSWIGEFTDRRHLRD